MNKKKIKVALLVDEYFGAVKTKVGGYGFLARHLVAKYLPSDDVEVDVLLKKGKANLYPIRYDVDGISVYKLANKYVNFVNNIFFNIKKYDVFLTIEMTTNSYRILNTMQDKHKKNIIFWIQDPRPQYEWDEIKTVKLFPEKSYWDENINQFVHQLSADKRVKFISQARFLDQKARDLYKLGNDVNIEYLPNPIEIDENFDVHTYEKNNSIVFLGRIESVKRGWLFAEIAKLLPQYQFYMLGQSFREIDKNDQIMSKYQNISNLTFVGHVEGEEKNNYLKNAKILINTSIHEALPVSFLEALSFGTLLVSCQNPDNLTEKFGVYTGKVLNDGFDKVNLFVDGVNLLMENEAKRKALSFQAVEYIKNIHSLDKFKANLTNKLAS